MKVHFFNEGQIIELNNGNIEEEEDVKDIELECIDIVIYEKDNRLRIVS